MNIVAAIIGFLLALMGFGLMVLSIMGIIQISNIETKPPELVWDFRGKTPNGCNAYMVYPSRGSAYQGIVVECPAK